MTAAIICTSRAAAPPAAVAQIARAAVVSLYAELACTPKPGLVTLTCRGSHRDMTAATLYRSLFTLRHYFAAIARAGARDARFAELQRLGIAAEARMLTATDGVNTHRGTIFALGLLAAAAGRCMRADAPGAKIGVMELSLAIRERWSDDIIAAVPSTSSHGLAAAWRHGASGARGEGAAGFPTVAGIGLPALRLALARGCSANQAMVHALFELIAVLEDTNLLHRGGASGLRFAQRLAREFLAAGSVCRNGWQAHAASIGRQFVIRNLSPGGSADLLAATCFVHALGSLQSSPDRASSDRSQDDPPSIG